MDPYLEPVERTTDYIVAVYSIYSVLAIITIAALALTLIKNGKHFLDFVFPDNTKLAKAVNTFIVTGFVLFSVGFTSRTIAGGYAPTTGSVFELTAQKFGGFLMIVAIVYFIILFSLSVMRRNAEGRQLASTMKTSQQKYQESLAKYNETLVAQSGNGAVNPL